MAERTTLARPYAKAAFEYADAAAVLDQWSSALQQLALVSSDEKVAEALSNPMLTAEQHAQTLIDLLADELDDKAKNFVVNIASNKRIDLLAGISALFDLMKANRERVLDVKIQAAYELSDAQQKKLADALGENLQRNINLDAETDTSLIGGAVIHAGDTLIDGSVKGHLNKLKEAIAT